MANKHCQRKWRIDKVFHTFSTGDACKKKLGCYNKRNCWADYNGNKKKVIDKNGNYAFLTSKKRNCID